MNDPKFFPESLSEVTRENFKALNTELVFVDKMTRFIGIKDYASINNHCSPLLLSDYDLKDMFSDDRDELIQNINKMTNDAKVKTVLMAAYELYSQEQDRNNNLESFNFVMLTLYQCGFNDFPLCVRLNKTDHFRTTPKGYDDFYIHVYGITRNLISITTHENEYCPITPIQCMTALLCLACHESNGLVDTIMTKQLPIYVFGISIIGTKFHFYKATATEDYIKKKKDPLQINKFATLDFMNKYNRKEILTILTYIREKCLEIVNIDIKFKEFK